jgi:hypothetical protein
VKEMSPRDVPSAVINFIRVIADDDLEESITSQTVSSGVEEGVKIN